LGGLRRRKVLVACDFVIGRIRECKPQWSTVHTPNASHVRKESESRVSEFVDESLADTLAMVDQLVTAATAAAPQLFPMEGSCRLRGQTVPLLDPEADTLVLQAFYPIFCTVALILLLNRTAIDILSYSHKPTLGSNLHQILAYAWPNTCYFQGFHKVNASESSNNRVFSLLILYNPFSHRTSSSCNIRNSFRNNSLLSFLRQLVFPLLLRCSRIEES
jgi:hypothetical protein